MLGIQQFKFLAILAICALTACNQIRPEDRSCKARQISSDESQEQAFAFGYFPAAFGEPSLNCGYPSGPSPVISKIQEEWYANQLQAACEPSLYELSKRRAPQQFELRFSLMPSFDPSFFVRIKKEGEDYKLIVKELSGAGGYDPGIIDRSKEILLSPDQVAELQRLLSEESLFDEPAKVCTQGFDGSIWLFEVVDDGDYKLVDRWSPSAGSARNMGLYLISLTGWDFGGS